MAAGMSSSPLIPARDRVCNTRAPAGRSYDDLGAALHEVTSLRTKELFAEYGLEYLTPHSHSMTKFIDFLKIRPILLRPITTTKAEAFQMIIYESLRTARIAFTNAIKNENIRKQYTIPRQKTAEDDYFAMKELIGRGAFERSEESISIPARLVIIPPWFFKTKVPAIRFSAVDAVIIPAGYVETMLYDGRQATIRPNV